MSLGYAEKLSYRDDVGAVGQKEHWDGTNDVAEKSKQLANMLRGSSKTVIMTGAGISTSIGIPDFRGPNGVWTCQKHGRPIPKLEGLTFASASPSLTHMAILELLTNGPAQYVVSQNVDGLHRRSGIPADRLAEVHGNCFLEKCPHCGMVYVRDFEMSSVGFKPTGRKCTAKRCRGNLKDMVLDWDDALPEDQLEASEAHARDADLVICLGTSLQIRPICNLPNVTVRNGGQVAIINLQKTPKNKSADLIIHGKCDEVMEQVMSALQRPLPVYERWDRFHLRLWYTSPKKRKVSHDEGELFVALTSSHGMACHLPMVDNIQWRFSQQAPAVDVKVGDHSNTCKVQKLDTDALKQAPETVDVCTSAVDSELATETREQKNGHEAAVSTDCAAAVKPGSVHSSRHRCDQEPSSCSGEVAVDGGEGPFVFTTKGGGAQRILHLQFKFGCGADACLRQQEVVLDIDIPKVPSIVLGTNVEKMWAAAESCQAVLELKTQVRDFSKQGASSTACRLVGTSVTLRDHSLLSKTATKAYNQGSPAPDVPRCR